jgi:hypothetical protein
MARSTKEERGRRSRRSNNYQHDPREERLRTEFNAHSADEAIASMVANLRVNQVPV